jgi:hypothetical protein
MTQGSFLYFIPGVQKEQLTRSFVASRPEAVPLFDLVHSPRLFSLHLQVMPVEGRGPDGSSGCIIAGQPVVDTPEQQYGYFPDVQKWQKIGERWIGYQTDMLPGPESLRRKTQISGQEVELNDGLIWLSPVIRPWNNTDWGCGLPLTIGLDEQGECTAQIDEKYSAIWRLSGKLVAVVMADFPETMKQRFSDAVECLSVNYRVGQPEATILKLFNTQAIREVLRTAVDADLVDLFETKAEATALAENPT